jgi:thiol-disulfide isomerase/thioredoxin
MSKIPLLVLLLLSKISFSQITISIHSEDSIPIFGANIYFNGKQIAQTNENGMAILKSEWLNDSLHINHPSYLSTKIFVTNTRIFYLKMKEFYLNDVEIIDYSKILKKSLSGKNPYYPKGHIIYKVSTYGFNNLKNHMKLNYYIDFRANSSKFPTHSFQDFYIEDFKIDTYFSTYFVDFYKISYFFHQNYIKKYLETNLPYNVTQIIFENRKAFKFKFESIELIIDQETNSIAQYIEFRSNGVNRVVFEFKNNLWVLKFLEWIDYSNRRNYKSLFTFRPDLALKNLRETAQRPNLAFFSLSEHQKKVSIRKKNDIAWSKTDSIFLLDDFGGEHEKIFLLDFYTKWCIPCKIMDKTVLSFDTVKQYLDKDFEFIKYDAEHDSGAVLAKKFSVQSYPTYIFLKNDSTEIYRFSGSRSVKDFLHELEVAKIQASNLIISKSTMEINPLRAELNHIGLTDTKFDSIAHNYISKFNTTSYEPYKDDLIIQKILTSKDSLFSECFLKFWNIKLNNSPIDIVKRHFYSSYLQAANQAFIRSDSSLIERIIFFGDSVLGDPTIKKEIEIAKMFFLNDWKNYLVSIEETLKKAVNILVDSTGNNFQSLLNEYLNIELQRTDTDSLNMITKHEDMLLLHLKLKLELLLEYDLDKTTAENCLKLIDRWKDKGSGGINFDVLISFFNFFCSQKSFSKDIYLKIKDNNLYEFENGLNRLEELHE